jgi:hypothetical protein
VNQLIAQRLKAVGAALISGVGAYVIAYLVQGQQFTLHGLESAVALAVVTGAGVHRLPNAPTSKQLQAAPKLELADRLALLPKRGDRKGGALPSPRDDRDYKAKLATKIPASVDNAKGLVLGMLLNDRIGDCYIAALLHALQVLIPGFTPTDAQALYLYEKVTGYDPTKTAADGSNPTDNGTAGRQLYDWALKNKLIGSYAAVPATRTGVKAAVVAYKVVLCEWALPAGCETEGDTWTMPRTGKAAGSWGGHATTEPGYTFERNRNITWGEEGSVTGPFEDSYLEAAWTIEAPVSLPTWFLALK